MDGTRLTVGEICAALELKRRPADAILAASSSLGLLDMVDGGYGLTAPAEDYLLESSPTYMGSVIDLVVGGDWSYSTMERAVADDRPQRADMDFASFEEQAEHARVFARAMHGFSFGPALIWPELVDLSWERTLLDVAGGSGAHSIGACLQWPQLQAIVLDLPSVCDVAEEFVARHELEDRITTRRADMWDDPFPPAGVHFYSNILHDWPPGKGRFLLEKSHAALESGGRILIHEALFDDDKTGPLTVAAFTVGMLAVTEGQQYSGRELTEMLADAGFRDTRITPACVPYSIVEARRP